MGGEGVPGAGRTPHLKVCDAPRGALPPGRSRWFRSRRRRQVSARAGGRGRRVWVPAAAGEAEGRGWLRAGSWGAEGALGLRRRQAPPLHPARRHGPGGRGRGGRPEAQTLWMWHLRLPGRAEPAARAPTCLRARVSGKEALGRRGHPGRRAPSAAGTQCCGHPGLRVPWAVGTLGRGHPGPWAPWAVGTQCCGHPGPWAPWAVGTLGRGTLGSGGRPGGASGRGGEVLVAVAFVAGALPRLPGLAHLPVSPPSTFVGIRPGGSGGACRWAGWAGAHRASPRPPSLALPRRARRPALPPSCGIADHRGAPFTCWALQARGPCSLSYRRGENVCREWKTSFIRTPGPARSQCLTMNKIQVFLMKKQDFNKKVSCLGFTVFHDV